MRRLGDARALGPGGAVEFEAVVRGEPRACFALRTPQGLRAYVNVCAHRNQPVVSDGRPCDERGLLECRAHGAFYDPATGLCVEGPCEGARLVPVPVGEADGGLFVEDDLVVDDSIYGG